MESATGCQNVSGQRGCCYGPGTPKNGGKCARSLPKPKTMTTDAARTKTKRRFQIYLFGCTRPESGSWQLLGFYVYNKRPIDAPTVVRRAMRRPAEWCTLPPAPQSSLRRERRKESTTEKGKGDYVLQGGSGPLAGDCM